MAGDFFNLVQTKRTRTGYTRKAQKMRVSVRVCV